MVRTLHAEWAYARPFRDTADRIALLPAFLDFYNRERPRGVTVRAVADQQAHSA